MSHLERRASVLPSFERRKLSVCFFVGSADEVNVIGTVSNPEISLLPRAPTSTIQSCGTLSCERTRISMRRSSLGLRGVSCALQPAAKRAIRQPKKNRVRNKKATFLRWEKSIFRLSHLNGFRRLERAILKAGIDEWLHRAGRRVVQFLGVLNQAEMLSQLSRKGLGRIADDFQPAAPGRSA